MRKDNVRQTKFTAYSSIIVIGFGVGWLVGLSVSPVVSIVVTSITGSAAAITAAMSGLEKKTDESDGTNTKWPINPLPLALLVIGLILGSIPSIYARNNSLLGSDISVEVAKWINVGLPETGISEEEIIRRLFEGKYPSSNRATSNQSSKVNPLGTYLFASDSQECITLIAATVRSDKELKRTLKSSTIKQLQSLPDIVEDPAVMRNIVEKVLCADR